MSHYNSALKYYLGLFITDYRKVVGREPIRRDLRIMYSRAKFKAREYCNLNPNPGDTNVYI